MEPDQTTPSRNTQASPFFAGNGEPDWKMIGIVLAMLLLLTVAITLLTEIIKPKSYPANSTLQLTPTPEPTALPAVNNVLKNADWKVYTSKSGNFTLRHPVGCKVSEDYQIITCYGSLGDYFTIYPESGNRDIKAPPGWFSTVTLGGKKWERKMTENKHVATYGQTGNGVTYRITVEYQQFSDKAQVLAESIIATFNSLALPTPTARP